MGEFWKNEWQLFKSDMGLVKDFLVQPVIFSDDTKMLRPSEQEIESKSQMGGFWTSEWNLFKQDINDAVDFLTQPISFK
ncbi:MAG: hypothetical protein RSB76_00910 [Clostridia bacterium]